MKIKFKGVVGSGSRSEGQYYKVEDHGMARIQTFLPEFGEGNLYLRLHSWDERQGHADWEKLAGKKVRITVEVVEDAITPEGNALNRAVDLLNEFYFDGPRTALHNKVFDFLQDIDRGPTIRRTPKALPIEVSLEAAEHMMDNHPMWEDLSEKELLQRLASAEWLLEQCHPEHPQPELCAACKYLKRVTD
jgi:hypothetical protein